MIRIAETSEDRPSEAEASAVADVGLELGPACARVGVELGSAFPDATACCPDRATRSQAISARPHANTTPIAAVSPRRTLGTLPEPRRSSTATPPIEARHYFNSSMVTEPVSWLATRTFDPRGCIARLTGVEPTSSVWMTSSEATSTTEMVPSA